MTTKIRPSTLENTTVSTGTYGGTTVIPVVTVDAQGRLTYAANATPSIAVTQITGSASDPSWISSLAKSKVGLSNVDNTADSSKSVSYASTAGSAPASDVYSWAKASTKPSYSKSEVGLGNVDNTADSSKSVSYASSAGGVAWDNVSSKPTILTLQKTQTSSYIGDSYSGWNDGGLPWATTGGQHDPVTRNFTASIGGTTYAITFPGLGASIAGTQQLKVTWSGTSIWWGGVLSIDQTYLGTAVENLRHATVTRTGNSIYWTNGVDNSGGGYRIVCGPIVHSNTNDTTKVALIPCYIVFKGQYYNSYYGTGPYIWPYQLTLNLYV